MGQPAAHLVHQHPVWRAAHRHGDRLQGLPPRRAAGHLAAVRGLRHRARDHRARPAGRLSDSRVAGRLQPAAQGRRQEDLVDRRHRRHLHAAAVPRRRSARAPRRPGRASPMSLPERSATGWLAWPAGDAAGGAGASRAVFPLADPPWLAPIGITWHDEGVWAHNARNKALFGQWRLDQWNPMYVSPVFTGLEYLSFSVFGVGLWQARVVSIVAGACRDRVALAIGLRATGNARRRAGRRVAAGGELHVGDVLAGGAAGSHDGRRPGCVVGVLRKGRAQLALGNWRGAASACSRSSRRHRRPSSWSRWALTRAGWDGRPGEAAPAAQTRLPSTARLRPSRCWAWARWSRLPSSSCRTGPSTPSTTCSSTDRGVRRWGSAPLIDRASWFPSSTGSSLASGCSASRHCADWRPYWCGTVARVPANACSSSGSCSEPSNWCCTTWGTSGATCS